MLKLIILSALFGVLSLIAGMLAFQPGKSPFAAAYDVAFIAMLACFVFVSIRGLVRSVCSLVGEQHAERSRGPRSVESHDG